MRLCNLLLLVACLVVWGLSGLPLFISVETFTGTATSYTVCIRASSTSVARMRYQDSPTFTEGIATNRAGLAQSLLLSSNDSGDGAALLAGIDAYAGGGEVQAWLATLEVRCHNCHAFSLPGDAHGRRAAGGHGLRRLSCSGVGLAPWGVPVPRKRKAPESLRK
ncbi:hypothetical protein [Myxococcus sp. CA040A]|uniref:hypothetical protein n=1 Tax=Myxococcus sp. CA040A TaxID=2741738 RepID=UPI0020C71D21|nr:hypothetical protein [Myxococcus sp. CA040A]